MAIIKTNKGILKFKPQIVYVGIKRIDKAIALENLKVVARIMNQSGLNWGPALGTLLGIIRENDFITWDEDIDLYIMDEDKEKFFPILFEFQKEGFDVIRYWRCGLVSIKRNGEYIDFYFMKDVGANVRCAVGEVFIFEKYLKDTIEWDFKGCKMNIPRNYEDILEFRYGDWRTPVQYADYEMTTWRKCKIISLLWIKNHMPDFLYYPLFRRHHQPALNKFLSKCKERNIELQGKVTLDYYKKEK